MDLIATSNSNPHEEVRIDDSTWLYVTQDLSKSQLEF